MMNLNFIDVSIYLCLTMTDVFDNNSELSHLTLNIFVYGFMINEETNFIER